MSTECYRNTEQGWLPLPGRIRKGFKVGLKREWALPAGQEGHEWGKEDCYSRERLTAWAKAWRLETSCFVCCVSACLKWQECGVHENKWWEQNLYSEQGPDYEPWSLKDLHQSLSWICDFGRILWWFRGGKTGDDVTSFQITVIIQMKTYENPRGWQGRKGS